MLATLVVWRKYLSVDLRRSYGHRAHALPAIVSNSIRQKNVTPCGGCDFPRWSDWARQGPGKFQLVKTKSASPIQESFGDLDTFSKPLLI
jgi:hypothetical protein